MLLALVCCSKQANGVLNMKELVEGVLEIETPNGILDKDGFANVELVGKEDHRSPKAMAPLGFIVTLRSFWVIFSINSGFVMILVELPSRIILLPNLELNSSTSTRVRLDSISFCAFVVKVMKYKLMVVWFIKIISWLIMTCFLHL